MLHLLRPVALAGALVLCAATPDPPPAPPSQATTPPPADPAKPTPASAPPAATEQVAQDEVVALLGLALNANGAKEVGRIVDVLVDVNGVPRAAVVDVGGFLGVGNRKVAVAWTSLRFSLGKTAAATLTVSSDSLKAAPAYDPAKPVEAVEAPAPTPPSPSTVPAAAPPAARVPGNAAPGPTGAGP